MSNGNGHRWSKFWWCDWQNDAALRMCSLAAQGYWMRALCIMHEAEPVGHLTVNGRVPTTRQLAAITGATEKEVTVYTHELEENGVFSRLPDGTIICRRMVRDAAATDEGRKWGKKGGNPNINPKGGGLTPPVNGEAKPDPLTEGVKLDLRSLEAEAEPPLGPPPKRGGRSRADKPRFKAGIFQLIADEGSSAADNVTPIDRFVALANAGRRVAN